MEDKKIEFVLYVLVERLASLLAWREQVQNLVSEKSRFAYESELMDEIRKVLAEK